MPTHTRPSPVLRPSSDGLEPSKNPPVYNMGSSNGPMWRHDKSVSTSVHCDGNRCPGTEYAPTQATGTMGSMWAHAGNRCHGEYVGPRRQQVPLGVL